MNEYGQKFVEFYVYCPQCKYNDQREDMDPCNDCLSEPVNNNSRKPVYFKKKE